MRLVFCFALPSVSGKLEPQRTILSTLNKVSVTLSNSFTANQLADSQFYSIKTLENKTFKFPNNKQGFKCAAKRKSPVLPPPANSNLSIPPSCTTTDSSDKIFRVCVGEEISVSIVRVQPSLVNPKGGAEEKLVIGNFGASDFVFSSASRSAQLRFRSDQGRAIVSEAITLEISGHKISGVSGAFNNFFKFPITGVTHVESTNLYGCKKFEKFPDTQARPVVLVVQRGECMFQLKALQAQRAGASALIIVNDKRPMLRWMAPVAGSLLPDIISALVDVAHANTVLISGQAVTIANESEGESGCEFELNMYCDSRSLSRETPWKCERGDEVIFKHGVDADQLAVIQELPGENNTDLAVISVFEQKRGDFSLTTIAVPRAQLFKDEEFNCAGSFDSAISRFAVSGSPLSSDHASRPVCRMEADVHVGTLCALSEFRTGGTAEIEVVCGLEEN